MSESKQLTEREVRHKVLSIESDSKMYHEFMYEYPSDSKISKAFRNSFLRSQERLKQLKIQYPEYFI